MSILRTFAPKQFFLRVDDKYLPRFIDLDPELKSVPSLVYNRLFSRCGNRDQCCISQKELASLCKCSVRSIQNHLRALVRLEYIQIHHGEEVDVCTYALLLSPRVASLLLKAQIDTTESLAPCPKNLRVGGEKFAYSLRDQDQDPPLSPLPKPDMPILQTVQRIPVSSCRDAKGSSSTPQTNGRGDSFSSWRQDFNSLWATWPDKAEVAWDMPRNRHLAFCAFGKLASSGQLPSIDSLLVAVERFKRTDSRWLNGYPPELSNWLRNRGWLKEPLVCPRKTFADSSRNTFGVSTPPPPTPEEQRRAEVFQQQFQALQKRYQQRIAPMSAPQIASVDVDALIALWPEPERQRVPVIGFINYLNIHEKHFNLAPLISDAKDYLATTRSPVSLLNWLRGNAMSAQTV